MMVSHLVEGAQSMSRTATPHCAASSQGEQVIYVSDCEWLRQQTHAFGYEQTSTVSPDTRSQVLPPKAGKTASYTTRVP